ncbi:MAG: hypothetical protein ABIR83_07325, partial [Nakamurella sp.]
MADQHAAPGETLTAAAPAGRHRAAGATTTLLIGHAALVVVAALTVWAGAPVWLTTVLAVAATAVVTERVVRHRGRGLLDASLVGCGMVVVTTVLLGLALDLTP